MCCCNDILALLFCAPFQIEDLSSNAQIAAAEKFKAPGASAPTTKETEQDMNVEDGDDGDTGEEVSVDNTGASFQEMMLSQLFIFYVSLCIIDTCP